jgi:hypothetical protein
MSSLDWKRLPPSQGSFGLRAYSEAGVFLLRVEPQHGATQQNVMRDRVTLSFFPARVNPHMLAFGGQRVGEFESVRAAQEVARRMSKDG